MKYAIISDIHANLSALTAVLKDAASQGAEAVVCLGDVVGYGPQPAETIALVRRTCLETLAGNHDDAVAERGDSSAFIDLAGDAIIRHRNAISSEALAWLKSRPYTTARIEGALASHGDFADPCRFYYIENEDDAEANFNATDAQLMFVGHTHIPQIFLTGRSGTIYRTDPQNFIVEDGKRYIVNPGSVGYPRESGGKCMSSYVIYDSIERSVIYRAIPFAVASVMQRGRGPRKIRAWTAAVTVIALLAATVAFTAAVVRSGRQREIVVVKSPSLVIRSGDKLKLLGDLRVVHPGLKLAKGSDPVVLEMKIISESGEISTKTELVKQSMNKAIKMPKGATDVEFVLKKNNAEDHPVIAEFSPSASAR